MQMSIMQLDLEIGNCDNQDFGFFVMSCWLVKLWLKLALVMQTLVTAY